MRGDGGKVIHRSRTSCPEVIPNNCLQAVNKYFVAMLQRPMKAHCGAVRAGLFAYNEVPAIAVAIDCWFRARHFSTRPFFLPTPF